MIVLGFSRVLGLDLAGKMVVVVPAGGKGIDRHGRDASVGGTRTRGRGEDGHPMRAT